MATQEEIDTMVVNALKSIRSEHGNIRFASLLVAIAKSLVTTSMRHSAKFKSICIVLNLAAIYVWELHGIDIKNAFLESDLEETIYMKLPVDTYEEANS